MTLEHLKRLEGEVINQLNDLGEHQDKLGFEGETVTPQQLLGIEINERAAALAELVLWIGYLQWHIRTRGNKAVAEPVVHDYGNIEHRDAVLAWSDIDLAKGANGQNLMRWDGKTKKTHQVTGEQVPDEAAQLPQWQYITPTQAKWPKADFIVGNPPFIGASTLRAALGDGYVQALRGAWPEVPESADFVMHWWSRAAALVTAGSVRQFGLITTNSLRQTFNRRVVQAALDKGLALTFAIPDHPWVDSANGAAVRIAMTVASAAPTVRAEPVEAMPARLLSVTSEQTGEHGEVAVTLAENTGLIHADLSVGANVASAGALLANAGISSPGVKLHGAGFIVTPQEATELGFGKVSGLDRHIREYRHGRDLTDTPRGVRVIDLFGLSAEQVREQFPAVYQRLLERVKPERDAKGTSKDGAGYAKLWWLHGKPRQEMRKQLTNLPRYIATVETAKHRTFQFLDASILPDNKLIAIAINDAFQLGVLSSKPHVAWSLATGSWLGVGNDPVYVKSRCFETFPFPDQDTGLTPALRQRIAALAGQIDAHRKRQQAAHTGLTLTGMYNVLEILRQAQDGRGGAQDERGGAQGERILTAKEKTIHQQGLVSVLKELHDELDAAVLQAYGLESGRGTDALLAHLVALNAQRAAEEKTGHIRWLRPEFQNPAARPLQNQELLAPVVTGLQADLALNSPAQGMPEANGILPPWPNTLPEQVRALAQLLASATSPLALPAIEARFKGKGPWKKGLPRILETLEALGRARREGDGWRA